MYTEGGGPNQDHGIVPGHAYSVIAVKSYHGTRLLEIRNPWGEFEWGGAWSDNSSEWTSEMIEVFKPSFDSKDGTFWMSYEDFFKYFNSITVCKVSNWNELRLRGKFIRCWEKEDPDEDWILSKFYYTFKLFEETELSIGIHQEDERILGSDRRGYLDLQILILKRHTNGTLTIEHESDSRTDREVYVNLNLSAGHYIVIPRTTGGNMGPPDNPKPAVPFKITRRGSEGLHGYYKSTFNDIFRKMDLQLNGQLSAEELNQFGELIDDDELRSITMKDFYSEKYWNLSCDDKGFTNFGLIQYLSKLSEGQIRNCLYKLGYDDSLYSTKSRVFTLSFHCEKSLRVRISDAMKTDLNERAWDLMMDAHHKKNGASMAIKNEH